MSWQKILCYSMGFSKRGEWKMAKFCGKCGRQLDAKTGLCPTCNKKKITAIRWRRFVIFTVIVVLAVGGLSALVWRNISDNGANADTTSTTGYGTEETAPAQTTAVERYDQIEEYLEGQVYPVYGQLCAELTLPYRGYLYPGVGSNRSSGLPLFEVEDGPVALFGIQRADYDQNGTEDLVTVELEASAPDAESRVKFGVPEGLCNLYFRVKMVLFDEKGGILSQNSRNYFLEPWGQGTASFMTANAWVICSEAYGYTQFFMYNSGNEYFYPVAPPDRVHGHSDFVSLNNFLVKNTYPSGYEYSRSITCYNDQDISKLIYYSLDPSGKNTILYSDSSSSTDMKVNSEEKACEEIKTALRKTGTERNFNIRSAKWNGRMGNTFLPISGSAGMICTIDIQSTASEPVGEHETAGIMTFRVNQSGNRNDMPTVPTEDLLGTAEAIPDFATAYLQELQDIESVMYWNGDGPLGELYDLNDDGVPELAIAYYIEAEDGSALWKVCDLYTYDHGQAIKLIDRKEMNGLFDIGNGFAFAEMNGKKYFLLQGESGPTSWSEELIDVDPDEPSHYTEGYKARYLMQGVEFTCETDVQYRYISYAKQPNFSGTRNGKAITEQEYKTWSKTWVNAWDTDIPGVELKTGVLLSQLRSGLEKNSGAVAAQPTVEEPVSHKTESESTMTLEIVNMQPYGDPISSVSASSTYSGDRDNHDAENLRDNDPQTNWTEGIDGYGIGESIRFDFHEIVQLNGFQISGGNQYDYDRFKDNGRPEWISLTFANGSSEVFRLKDVLKSQTFELSVPVETDSVVLTINTAYEGRRYEDTVISDVSFDAFVRHSEVKEIPSKSEECTYVKVASVLDHDSNETSTEYGIVTGYDENNAKLWTYESRKYNGGAQFGSMWFVGTYGNTLYISENGTLLALDLSSGAIRWKNKNFGGVPTACAFDENGTLYITSYLSPDLFVVDKYGSVIQKIGEFDDNFYWPSQITLEDSVALITMDGHPIEIKDEDSVITVDIRDFSYDLPAY